MLEAAGRLFALQGFDGVSTRTLAKAAGVNLSAITYHFGGKEGLYHAVLEQLVADTDPLVKTAIERLAQGTARAEGNPEALARLAAWFVNHLLASILGEARYRWQMALMLREFYQPSGEFPMLLEKRIHPLHDAVAGLVAAATGHEPQAPETRLLTHAIIGQCMIFGAARTVVWARLGWDGYSPQRVALIAGIVTASVQAMLGLPRVAPEGAAAGAE
ncbi:MAG: CerR family C-terminal domain-containing protein [Alphaproteobacteria bacterium]